MRDLPAAPAAVAGHAPPAEDVIASLTAGLYTLDRAGIVTSVNPAALAMLGYTAEELLGHAAADLLHGAQTASAPLIMDVATTGQAVREDQDRFLRGDGSLLPTAWIASPLIVSDEILGVVVVFSDTRARLAVAELRDQALLAAHALDRVAATEAEERSRLLVELADLLTTLDLDEGMRRLAQFLTGRLADAVVVDVLDGSAVTRVAVAEGARSSGTSAGTLGPLPPLTTASQGVLARALTSGEVQLFASADETATDALDEEKRRMLARLNAQHALVVPMTARRQVLGAVTLVRTNAAAGFSETERQMAGEIGRRAGLSLDNARLHGQQRSAAEVLQRSMLTVLPETPGIQLAARYLPAADGVEVGGDWYDGFRLPGGDLMLVIGDVVGHDIHAASTMGQLRNLLRAVAIDRGAGPAEVLQRTESSSHALAMSPLATCLVAQLHQDRSGGRVMFSWANAGHMPPAVVTAGGELRLLEEDPDPMLGVLQGLPPRDEHRHDLRPADRLWLYTDGLVERPGENLEIGLTRLRRSLLAVAKLPLSEACDRLVTMMLPRGHPDDVAVLAVDIDAEGSEHAHPRPS